MPLHPIIPALALLLSASAATAAGTATSAPFPTPPTPEQVEWVRLHALPFPTTDPGSGTHDLFLLGEVIESPRIVALGESTHGSREIFQMKHRLLEHLAGDRGYTIFSIEANMPECRRLNDYVLGGEGDPRELIKGMYFWTWNTEEVLAMVRWMREFNLAGNGPLQFTGFDMQTPNVAIEIVREFIAEHDAPFLEELDGAYAAAKRAEGDGGGGGGGAPFGVATGSFPVEEVKGKHVRYSGMIRTEGVTQFAGLWWRADGPDGKVLAFDNMQARGPKGDTDWQRYEVTLDVPPETININFGVIMPGEGTAWFDDLKVELDGEAYKDVGLFDFSFEGQQLQGLFAPPGGRYTATIDNQHAHAGTQSLRLKHTPRNGARANAVDANEAAAKCHAVVEHMEASREDYLKASDPKSVDWAIQNARIVLQATRNRANPAVRDEAMAQNVKWLLDQNPESRIVLWAHNGHIAKSPGAMGKYLDEMYGKDYVALGFATARGRYTAIGGGALGDHLLKEPPEGSAEAIFAATGIPRFIVDLRPSEAGAPASGWLHEPRPFRSIGALAMAAQFHPQKLAELYDLIVYIEETTPAVQIGADKPPAEGAGEQGPE